MSDLNWNLRDILHEFKDSRLPVFISIFLHKNTRNRSWPSNELIATETGLSSAPISAAIGWLIEKHVVVLVPFDKRVGLEIKLSNRKNIYQMTGVVLVDEEYHPYMNLTPEGWESVAADLDILGNSLLSKQLNDVDSLLSKCLDSKRKGIKGIALDSEGNKPIVPDGKKVSKPDAIPAALMTPMKNAIADAFGWDWKSMTKQEIGLVQGTAKDLCTAGFEPERVTSYHAWCKAKFTKGFSPKALSAHLQEYRLTRLDAPVQSTDKPMTEWEYDLANIQEQQKREAAQYGWT
jgi:hypothetical protein